MTRHAARVAAGQCYRCGAGKSSPYCASCRQERNRARAEMRAGRATRNMCPMCGVRRQPRGGTNCRPCQDQLNGYSRASHRHRRAEKRRAS